MNLSHEDRWDKGTFIWFNNRSFEKVTVVLIRTVSFLSSLTQAYEEIT